jgi:hypothetical protein
MIVTAKNNKKNQPPHKKKTKQKTVKYIDKVSPNSIVLN